MGGKGKKLMLFFSFRLMHRIFEKMEFEPILGTWQLKKSRDEIALDYNNVRCNSFIEK